MIFFIVLSARIFFTSTESKIVKAVTVKDIPKSLYYRIICFLCLVMFKIFWGAQGKTGKK